MGNKEERIEFLILPLDVEERVFDSIDELHSWVREEQSKISWLQAVSRNDGSLQQVWNHFDQWMSAIDQAVQSFKQHNGNEQQQQNILRQLINQFSQFNRKATLKTSCSPDVEFANHLRESASDIEAGYALAYLFGTNFNLSSPASMSGAFKAFHYQKGETSTVEAQQEALESVKRSWSQRFGNQLSKLKTENENLSKEKESLTSEIQVLREELSGIRTAQKSEFSELVDASKNALADVERTYDQKLALQSSVSYWSGKRRSHTIVMSLMGIITLAIAGATVGGVLFVAREYLQVRLPEIQAWQLGLVLAISTFGVWLTRLSTKIFISNLHLRTDADERVTMIQTYLAMLRDGDGIKEDDRQLVLQTLFRPSATGYISEELPHSPYDVLGSILKRGPK